MASMCFACGQKAMEKRTGTFQFDPPNNIPGGTIEITDAVWEECSKCGEKIIAHELDQAIEREGLRRRGLLLPEEIKAIRERTGLSQEDLAALLGIGDKTDTRWETGKSIQNKANDNLIRLVDRYADCLFKLDVERRPERKREIHSYLDHLSEIKGENKLAMAAHGGQLSSSVAEQLRHRLRELAGIDQGNVK